MILLTVKDDLGTMTKWMDEYGQYVGSQGGRIMGWYRGPNPALWTTSPEIIKEVFIKDAENFIDRPMLDRSDNIPHLINMRGETWQRARNVLTTTFTAAKMKKMSGIMGSTILFAPPVVNTPRMRLPPPPGGLCESILVVCARSRAPSHGTATTCRGSGPTRGSAAAHCVMCTST